MNSNQGPGDPEKRISNLEEALAASVDANEKLLLCERERPDGDHPPWRLYREAVGAARGAVEVSEDLLKPKVTA